MSAEKEDPEVRAAIARARVSFAKIKDKIGKDRPGDQVDEEGERDRKRSTWENVELREGEPSDYIRLSERRGFTLGAIGAAVLQGVLRFCRWNDGPGSSGAEVDAWLILSPTKDDKGRPICAEARKMDGKAWHHGGKADTFPGSRKDLLIGIENARLMGPDASFDDSIAIVEGGPALIGAYDYILHEGVFHRVSPVAILGASVKWIEPDHLRSLEGRSVRIFPDPGKSGEDGAKEWAGQVANITLDSDVLPLPLDLDDLWNSGFREPLMNF